MHVLITRKFVLMRFVLGMLSTRKQIDPKERWFLADFQRIKTIMRSDSGIVCEENKFFLASREKRG